jgi:HD-GYP domain-containing protein (c-di-GMP phosphodiesterase class II)
MVGGVQVVGDEICLVPISRTLGNFLVEVQLWEVKSPSLFDPHPFGVYGAGNHQMLANMAVYGGPLSDRVDRNYVSSLFSLARALDVLDPHTTHHSARTLDMARKLAIHLGCSAQEVRQISLASGLHDIGKVVVPKDVLTKPSRLTVEEWEVIKKHPAVGASLLARSPRLKRIASLVLYHHERYDGYGYPHRITGEQIPLGARILAVTDAFTTMTDGRVYKEEFTVVQALAELQRCRGTQFDPHIVDAMVDLIYKNIITR